MNWMLVGTLVLLLAIIMVFAYGVRMAVIFWDVIKFVFYPFLGS